MPPQPAHQLSLRGSTSLKNTSNALWDTLGDLWHPENNPHGIVSLGLADNCLMQSQLLHHINVNSEFSPQSLTLGDTIAGSVRLRTAITQFLNRYMSPAKPLLPSQLITTNGVTSAIEHCSWALCDPGDGIMIGCPYYRAFGKDVSLRPASKLVPVSFEGGDPLSVSAVSRYEDAILQSQQQGCTIRVIMLCNPHNPLGRCYSPPFLVELMKLCQKFGIHLVSDEIYALSVWRHGRDGTATMEGFTSVLSIDTEGIIDPGYVHTLWGASKDFGSNGLRLGVVVSPGSPALLECIRGVGQYSSISGLTDSIMTTVLEDRDFVDRYIGENRDKLHELYGTTVAFLDLNGIPYARGSNAAFFIWCDLLTPYLKSRAAGPYQRSDAARRVAAGELKKNLRLQKLHLGVGDDFGCEELGWYRLTFSQHSEILTKGFERLIRAIRA